MTNIIFDYNKQYADLNALGPKVPRICEALDIKPRTRWDVREPDSAGVYISFDTKMEAGEWLVTQWHMSRYLTARVFPYKDYPDIARNYGAWQTAVARLAAFGFLLSISCVMSAVEGVYWLARLRCIDGGTRGEHIGSGNDPLAATCFAAVALLDAAEKEGWSLRPSGQTAYPELPYWA